MSDGDRAAVLYLPAGLAAQIVSHAQQGFPEEVCGLVAGRWGCAMEVYPGRNISPTPRVAYELDHETVARLIDFEDAGLELVAIYHSHPAGPEVPSEADIARAAYPDAVYLIVSLVEPTHPVLRGFRIVEGRVREVEICCTQPPSLQIGSSLAPGDTGKC